MLDWNLTPLMRALVDAAERMGGGGRESEMSREAASRGESGRYGDAAHFGKAFRELERRGIFRGEVMGDARIWWLTEEAWRDLGHEGESPRTQQLGIFG